MMDDESCILYVLLRLSFFNMLQYQRRTALRPYIMLYSISQFFMLSTKFPWN